MTQLRHYCVYTSRLKPTGYTDTCTSLCITAPITNSPKMEVHRQLNTETVAHIQGKLSSVMGNETGLFKGSGGN